MGKQYMSNLLYWLLSICLTQAPHCPSLPCSMPKDAKDRVSPGFLASWLPVRCSQWKEPAEAGSWRRERWTYMSHPDCFDTTSLAVSPSLFQPPPFLKISTLSALQELFPLFLQLWGYNGFLLSYYWHQGASPPTLTAPLTFPITL